MAKVIGVKHADYLADRRLDRARLCGPPSVAGRGRSAQGSRETAPRLARRTRIQQVTDEIAESLTSSPRAAR